VGALRGLAHSSPRYPRLLISPISVEAPRGQRWLIVAHLPQRLGKVFASASTSECARSRRPLAVKGKAQGRKLLDEVAGVVTLQPLLQYGPAIRNSPAPKPSIHGVPRPKAPVVRRRRSLQDGRGRLGQPHWEGHVWGRGAGALRGGPESRLQENGRPQEGPLSWHPPVIRTSGRLGVGCARS
jgi:hypothetical protein